MKKNNMLARHEAAIAAKLKAEYDAQLDIALQMGLDDSKDDPNIDWSTTKIDQRLRQIVGDEAFQPWEERYGR